MKYKLNRYKIVRLITYYENKNEIHTKVADCLRNALIDKAKSTKQKSTGKEPGGCGGNPDYLPKSTGKEKCKSCNGTLEATDGMGNEVDCFRCNGTGFEPTRPKPKKIEEIEDSKYEDDRRRFGNLYADRQKILLNKLLKEIENDNSRK